MIDATDFNPDYKETFRQFIENVKEFSPNVEKIYVLINKINLHEADPDQVYNIITDGLAEDDLKLIVNTPVSVKFGSAQKRLIEILNEVLQDSTSEMQKLNEIRSALENLKSQSDAEFFLFNRPDGLIITSTLGKVSADPLNFVSLSMGAVDSNIDSILLKIWERMGKDPELIQLAMITYEAENNYILIRELNDFVILMTITHEKSSQAISNVLDVLHNSEDVLDSLSDLLPQHVR